MEKITILHEYPKTKDESLFVKRYSKEDFEKYNGITKSLDNYEKWKNGINYKTNRKIKIGGKTHMQIGYNNFYIKYGTPYSYSYVLFTELDGINSALYLQETEKLKEEILDYNAKVNDVISKIKLLATWEQYVEFEGTKYGLPIVYNGKHMENNCFGLIKEDYYENCHCSTCENWNGCGSGGTQYYKCNKCDYKYSNAVDGSRNYKGK